jgi:hypothetical protein
MIHKYQLYPAITWCENQGIPWVLTTAEMLTSSPRGSGVFTQAARPFGPGRESEIFGGDLRKKTPCLVYGNSMGWDSMGNHGDVSKNILQHVNDVIFMYYLPIINMFFIHGSV